MLPAGAKNAKRPEPRGAEPLAGSYAEREISHRSVTRRCVTPMRYLAKNKM